MRHDTLLLHASSLSGRNASLLFVYENCLYKQRKCYCEFSARKLVSERSERQTNRLLRTDSFTCRSWWNCISKMFVIGRNARWWLVIEKSPPARNILVGSDFFIYEDENSCKYRKTHCVFLLFLINFNGVFCQNYILIIISFLNWKFFIGNFFYILWKFHS